MNSSHIAGAVATSLPRTGRTGVVRNLAWLQPRADAVDCLNALAQANISTASWLIVDHYGLDAKWEGQLLTALTNGTQPRLLVIDDLADRPHQANLLLDSNFFGDSTENRYNGLVTQKSRQLLGPHYALLAPEYPICTHRSLDVLS